MTKRRPQRGRVRTLYRVFSAVLAVFFWWGTAGFVERLAEGNGRELADVLVTIGCLAAALLFTHATIVGRYPESWDDDLWDPDLQR